MIGTVLLGGAAVFLGWLALNVADPIVAGLFTVGASIAAGIAAGCALAWYLSARQLRRSTR